MQHLRFNDRPGVTLLEVVFVLSLLGFLVYLGAGSFMALAPKYKLENAVREIRTALNFARYKAVLGNCSVRVRFGASGWDMDCYDAKTKSWRLWRREIPAGVRIDANNTPIFTAAGTVSGLATIVVTNGWGSYKLTLAITGRVKTTRTG